MENNNEENRTTEVKEQKTRPQKSKFFKVEVHLLKNHEKLSIMKPPLVFLVSFW